MRSRRRLHPPSGELKLEEEVRKARLLVHDADYLIAFNPQRGAHGGGGSCCRVQAGDRRDRLFSNEDAWPEQGDAPSNA
jgi:hypothetical protein